MSETCPKCGKFTLYVGDGCTPDMLCKCWEKSSPSSYNGWSTTLIEKEEPNYSVILERIAVALENILYEINEIRRRS